MWIRQGFRQPRNPGNGKSERAITDHEAVSLKRKPPIRAEDGQVAATPQDAVDLAKRLPLIRDVFEHLVEKHAVEYPVGKRKGLALVNHEKANVLPADRSFPAHRDSFRQNVYPSDVGGTALGQADCVAPIGAAIVQPLAPDDAMSLELSQPICHIRRNSGRLAGMPRPRCD